MRICLGKSVNEIKHAVNVRLNQTWHSSVKNTPCVLIKDKKSTKERYDDKIEERRESMKFRVGEYIYIKNFSTDKTEPIWLGPFEIIELGKNCNTVVVRVNNGSRRISIKNIRGEAGCGDPHFTSKNKYKNKIFYNPKQTL